VCDRRYPQFRELGYNDDWREELLELMETGVPTGDVRRMAKQGRTTELALRMLAD
jgi:hypothetical protein